ncbi:MAG: TolB family protein [Planctomycetota bacterium]
MTSRSVAGASLALALAGSATGQVTRRMSLHSSGVEGNLESQRASVSADGRYVAFESRADNLVTGDSNMTTPDIFVRDRWLGTTELASVNSNEVQAGSFNCSNPAISADGRYVAFWSAGNNFVPGDTNSTNDVFVRDRQLGTTERVSIDSAGVEGTNESGGNGAATHLGPSISADGRYVAFWSRANNLVAGDTNGTEDVFLRDRQLGTTERVSVSTSGTQGNFDCYHVRLTPDGRYVAFSSLASTLVGGDSNSLSDVFVRDRQLGTTERVSIGPAGLQANGNSYLPVISDDGRFVSFYSGASNLVVGDASGAYDVFVHDRQTGTTELASVDSSEVQGNGPSGYPMGPTMSADGRYVAFESDASNLVAGDTNGGSDIFLRDRQLGTTVRVSTDSSAAQGNGISTTPTMSPDARWIVFESLSSNFVTGDTNAVGDVFIHDRDATAFKSHCHPGTGGVIGCPCGQPPNPAGGCANHGAGATSGAVLSASGVAYLSADTLLLTTSNHRSPAIGVLNVFFSFKPGTATPTTGIPSGAGVRCIGTGGDLRRLYTMQVFGGTGSKPGMGDPSVSARSAQFIPHTIAPGETRYYFSVYRDGQASGPCGNPLTTTNLTNMGSIGWGP